MQMPDFRNVDIHIPLLLVECTALRISCTTLTANNMFREWASSPDGIHLYLQLLETLRGSTSGATLMLSLAALLSVQRFSQTVSSNTLRSSRQASLQGVDHFIAGNDIIGGAESRVALEHMILSFSRAITHPVGLDNDFSQQFLDPVLRQIDLPPSRDRLVEQYLLVRLSSKGHMDAVAQVWHDVATTVPRPVNDMDYTCKWSDTASSTSRRMEEKGNHSVWWFCPWSNSGL